MAVPLTEAAARRCLTAAPNSAESDTTPISRVRGQDQFSLHPRGKSQAFGYYAFEIRRHKSIELNMRLDDRL